MLSSPVIQNPSALPSHSPLTFILEICGTLKRLKRTGWVKRQIPFPESDADHMHRVALTSLLYHQTTTDAALDYSDCPELDPVHIDAHHLLKMALTHDLCEAIAGDVTPHCHNALVSSKEAAEEDAMRHIARVVGEPLGSELAALWREYEDQQTPTAVIVKDIDKLEMLVQALEYEQEHLRDCRSAGGNPLQDTPRDRETHAAPPSVCDEPLRDFFQRCQGQFRTPLYRRLDAELRARRRQMLQTKGWDVTEGER